MSTAFMIANASRKLEKYLSREYYNLDKMSENERIPASLLETKVEQYNELVDTLNELFASLTRSGQPLFKRYGSEETPMVAVSPMLEQEETPAVKEIVLEEPEEKSEKPEESPIDSQEEPETETEEPEDDLPIWQIEGYSSYEEWCMDKEVEGAEVRDDVSVGVNTHLSQYQAEKVLREYQEAQEQDITTYNPEDDTPISVLPEDQKGQKPMRPTEDLFYLNHTADGTRVDKDPTQIAKVQTAVEQDYENAGKGADIDVSNFIYQSNQTVVDHLIDEEISKLHVSREEES